METSFVKNNDFRNDLLLSYLSKEEVQNHNDVFDVFYTDSLEEYIFGLTSKENVKLDSLKQGRDLLTFKSSESQSTIKM